MLAHRFKGWKTVLHIAWPLIIANAFWNLQLTIDRIFLGQFSPDALGAAVASMGIFWVPMALVQQTASYVTTFAAQYHGAGQNDQVGESLWQSIYVSIAGGLLFLLLIPVAPFVISLFGHSSNMEVLEIQYFQALCFSALPTALVASASGFFTGIEKTKIIMQINAVGLIFNVILDYVMIFGKFGFPMLGITGAGYATALAGLFASIYGFILIFQAQYESSFKTRSKWRWNPEMILRYIRYGVPSGLQWALEGLAFTLFLIFIGRMGDAELSASGITVTIMMLSILPAMGVAQAVMVLVGKHLGEKTPQYAQEYTWRGLEIVALYMCVLGVSFAMFPEFYLTWFYNEQDIRLWKDISRIVPVLLIFVALFAIFDAINFVLSFALKGAGDTKFVSLVALLLPWPLMVIPCSLIVDWKHGVYWAWGFASLYIMAQALVFLFRFIQGKWKFMSVMN